jgi:ABC-type nitrate/sulfonate/bicarbonate transport system permease component
MSVLTPGRRNATGGSPPADAAGGVSAGGGPGTVRRRGSSLLAGAGRYLTAAILIALLVVGWELYVIASGISPEILPSPVRVAVQGWHQRHELYHNTIPTFVETTIGFGISIAVAWLLATAIDFSPFFRRALYPVLVASQTIPMIAIAPLVVIWFGFGLTPKVVVIVLVTFFPMTVNLLEGFASTEGDATSLLRSMGANHIQLFWRLRIPNALPYFFAGLRIAIAFAVSAAVFAEYVGAISGLGIYMQVQKNEYRTDLVLAAVVVTAVLSILLFLGTFVIQRLVIPWYYINRRVGTQE